MLRPSGSYPRACPYWMHALTAESGSLSGISPLSTNASLFNRGRHCSTLYDYGFSKLSKKLNYLSISTRLAVRNAKFAPYSQYSSTKNLYWGMGGWVDNFYGNVFCYLHIHDIVVFPCGSRTSPGSLGGVPEILPAEITKVRIIVP